MGHRISLDNPNEVAPYVPPYVPPYHVYAGLDNIFSASPLDCDIDPSVDLIYFGPSLAWGSSGECSDSYSYTYDVCESVL